MTLVIKKKAETEQVQVQKPKAKKSVTKSTPQALSETEVLVNELVHLEEQMKALEVAKMQARHDELKKRLQSIANENFEADVEAVLEGTNGKVIFSPRRTTTSIVDREQMIKLLSPKTFMELANVSLTDLKKYLSENEIESFVGKSFGARTLKAVASTNK